MGTVSKALELLECFTNQRPQVGLSELARLAGLNKATCYRMISELAESGLVEQIGTSREYRIGAGVLRLAALREAHVPTRETAMPVLRRMAQTTGETSHLSLIIKDRLVTLAFAYSSAHGTQVMMEDADTLPWHATSSGHAALAFLPRDRCAALLTRDLQAHTADTPTNPEQIERSLEAVRRSGMAHTRGTFEADVESCAVALFDATGGVTGALGCAAPSLRMSEQRRQTMQRATVQAAREIIHLWGGQTPAPVLQAWAQLG